MARAKCINSDTPFWAENGNNSNVTIEIAQNHAGRQPRARIYREAGHANHKRRAFRCYGDHRLNMMSREAQTSVTSSSAPDKSDSSSEPHSSYFQVPPRPDGPLGCMYHWKLCYEQKDRCNGIGYLEINKTTYTVLKNIYIYSSWYQERPEAGGSVTPATARQHSGQYSNSSRQKETTYYQVVTE